MTEELIKLAEQCGAVGFTPEQTASILGMAAAEVQRQFIEEKGDIYECYTRGRLTTELRVRQKVIDEAVNGGG